MYQYDQPNQFNNENKQAYGSRPSYYPPPVYGNGLFDDGPEGKSRGVAMLLAIFTGSLGLHYFYLGKTTGGIVYLIITLFSCGTVTGLLGLIQGIIMLGMTNEEFRRHYVLNPSSMPF